MTKSRLFGAVATAAVLVVGGCNDDAETEETGAVTAELSIQLPTFDIPVGESFQCFYSDVVSEKDLSVVSANGKQVAGGHHLTLYYVDTERPVGMEECSGAEMVDWHFVAGAGGEGNEDALLVLPKGLAIQVPKGKQLMVQAHYINVSGDVTPAKDSMTLGLTDADKVEAYAADFVIDDDQFEIEPHAELTSVMNCEVPQDLNLAMLIGHMHEAGAHYTLEEVDASGEPMATLYESEWVPSFASHPPVTNYGKDAPLALKKGTLLRQTCSWKNDTDKKLLFPTEMCIGFGYYFPGTERIMCERTQEAQ